MFNNDLIYQKRISILPIIQESFNIIKEKCSNKEKELYEQLIINFVDPKMEWGKNNLRDLILLFYQSGKSEEQIYNILYLMGVEKEIAYDAIKQYLSEFINKKNNDNMPNYHDFEKFDENKIKIKSDTVSSFSLKDKIKNILENIDTYKTKNTEYIINSIKTICEKYFLKFLEPHISEYEISLNLINELNQYAWIDLIAETINDINSYINKNIISFKVNDVLSKLKTSRYNNFYKNAIDRLEQIKDLNESELKEKIKYELSDLTWIPEVKNLVSYVNQITGKLNSNQDVIIEKVYSPIFLIEGKYCFYLYQKVYQINENNELKEIDLNKLSALYLTLIAVTENFKFNKNSIKYFKDKNVIEFNLLESNKVEFKFNNQSINIKDSNDIRNFLLSNGSFNMNDIDKLNMVCKAYENLNSFVELDFVHSMHSRINKGIIVNLIRLNEKLYINYINSYMGINKLIKPENTLEAVNLVKEYINYDIKPIVADLLQEDIKKQIIIESKRNSIFEKINFLKEQKLKLVQSDLNNNPLIEQANKLLSEEIKELENQLKNLS